MATELKNIILPKYAENTQTTQYTASGVKFVIDKFVATNVTSAVSTLSINIVPGTTAGNSNLIVKEFPIEPGGSYSFPEIVGTILLNNYFISTLCSDSSAITISAYGREIS